MEAADIVCVPSRWESSSYVALEAGLAARPVVAADVDGVNEIVLELNDLRLEALVFFGAAGEEEGVGDGGFSLDDLGDDVAAAEPMGFGQVGCGPLCGVVGGGMVEADDVFAALAAFALDADEFFRVDVVAVVGRIGAGVAGTSDGGDGADAVVVHATEEDAAALVGVGFFAVLAEGLVVAVGDF